MVWSLFRSDHLDYCLLKPPCTISKPLQYDTHLVWSLKLCTSMQSSLKVYKDETNQYYLTF